MLAVTTRRQRSGQKVAAAAIRQPLSAASRPPRRAAGATVRTRPPHDPCLERPPNDGHQTRPACAASWCLAPAPPSDGPIGSASGRKPSVTPASGAVFQQPPTVPAIRPIAAEPATARGRRNPTPIASNHMTPGCRSNPAQHVPPYAVAAEQNPPPAVHGCSRGSPTGSSVWRWRDRAASATAVDAAATRGAPGQVSRRLPGSRGGKPLSGRTWWARRPELRRDGHQATRSPLDAGHPVRRPAGRQPARVFCAPASRPAPVARAGVRRERSARVNSQPGCARSGRAASPPRPAIAPPESWAPALDPPGVYGWRGAGDQLLGRPTRDPAHVTSHTRESGPATILPPTGRGSRTAPPCPNLAPAPGSG